MNLNNNKIYSVQEVMDMKVTNYNPYKRFPMFKNDVRNPENDIDLRVRNWCEAEYYYRDIKFFDNLLVRIQNIICNNGMYGELLAS